MKEAQMTIPHLFRCPISLDLFTDPVTLCTGQTYDRSSIEKWLAAGNLTCPVTMQKLHDPSLVPNHNLRHLIEQWYQMGHRFDPDYLTTIDPLIALKHKLETPESTMQEKHRAVEEIRVLITDERYSFLVQMGFFPLLLKLVFEKVLDVGFSPEHVKFVEQSLSCVLKLMPFAELESLNMLKEEPNLESFVCLFEHGSGFIKQSLCQLVVAISSSAETRELCGLIGQSRRFLHRIIVSLAQQNSDTSDYGLKAVSALCCLESNREKLVEQGAISGMITYILNSERKERSLAATATAVVEQLLGIERARAALISNPNGVKAVVKMVFRVSEHEGSESAVNSLMMVCHESLQAREKAMDSGVLTQLLLLLQSQCSGRTKTKARALLKLLRSKWDEDQ